MYFNNIVPKVIVNQLATFLCLFWKKNYCPEQLHKCNIMVLLYYMHSRYWMFTVIFCYLECTNLPNFKENFGTWFTELPFPSSVEYIKQTCSLFVHLCTSPLVTTTPAFTHQPQISRICSVFTQICKICSFPDEQSLRDGLTRLFWTTTPHAQKLQK